MTAIAYRDGIMAADSAERSQGTLLGYAKKIARLSDGTLVAGAGQASACVKFVAWISGGEDGKLDIQAEDFAALVVKPDGRVFRYDKEGFALEINGEFHAEGCAYKLLIGAMAAGASAEEAVNIAVQYDGYCGGDVQVERLNAP